MKLLDTAVLANKQPRMVELTDKLVINGHVYDKTSLTPDKMSYLPIVADTLDMFLNNAARPNIKNRITYNNVIQDNTDSKITYVIENSNNRACVYKIQKNSDGTFSNLGTALENSSEYQFIDQDGLYLYLKLRYSGEVYYMTKINKLTLGKTNTHIVTSSETKINIIYKNDTDIYFALSYDRDKLAIYKYQRFTNALTILKNDQPTEVVFNFSCFGAQDSSNGLIMARNERSFNGDSKVILKRYLIDAYEQKVYDKSIQLDCSLLPGNKVPIIYSSTDSWKLEYFKRDTSEYLVLYELYNHKKLYLARKTKEDEYTIIQEMTLGLSYHGLMIHNNCRTLILYNETQVGFYTFSDFEERYELTHTEYHIFDGLGVDKSQRIWLKNTYQEVLLLSENNPIKAEVEFSIEDATYKNEPIETTLQVYSKSFTGGLITSDVEIVLNGPIYFSDTQTQIKKVKTLTSSVSTIPVTITGVGYVEANVNII